MAFWLSSVKVLLQLLKWNSLLYPITGSTFMQAIAPLVQKRGDRLHESILHKGDSFLVPAGQPSYWCQAPDMSDVICAPLHICLKPEFIKQVAEASDIDSKRFDLVHCFGQQDLQLDQIGMLMFALVAIGWDDGAIICRITHSNPGDSFTTALFDPNATDWITKQQLNSYPVAASDRLHPRSSESRFILG